MQVRQRRPGLVFHVAAASYSSVGATGNQHRRFSGRMLIRIAHPGAVEDRHVIEQRAVAIRRGTQFLQILGEERREMDLDLEEVRDLLRVPLVM